MKERLKCIQCQKFISSNARFCPFCNAPITKTNDIPVGNNHIQETQVPRQNKYHVTGSKTDMSSDLNIRPTQELANDNVPDTDPFAFDEYCIEDLPEEATENATVAPQISETSESPSNIPMQEYPDTIQRQEISPSHNRSEFHKAAQEDSISYVEHRDNKSVNSTVKNQPSNVFKEGGTQQKPYSNSINISISNPVHKEVTSYESTNSYDSMTAFDNNKNLEYENEYDENGNYNPNYDHYYDDELPDVVDKIKSRTKEIVIKSVAIVMAIAILTYSLLLYV